MSQGARAMWGDLSHYYTRYVGGDDITPLLSGCKTDE